MTRRMIDSSMWSNENFAALPAMARLLQIGMINHADDQGRVKAHPLYLAKEIFPYDRVTPTNITKWLDLIAGNGTIVLYTLEGKQYAQLTKWWEYQSLQYAAPSDYPAPPNWKDRIRRTATKMVIVTYNWTLTNGTTVPDTCDEHGKPLPKPLISEKLPSTPTPTTNGNGHSPVDSPESRPEHSPDDSNYSFNLTYSSNSTKEGDRACAQEPPQPPPLPPLISPTQLLPTEYIPGVKRPQQNQVKRNCDHFTGKAAQHGVGPEPFRLMVDSVLTATGKLALANTNGDAGQSTLNQAKDTVATLLEMGLSTLEDVQAVLVSWRENDYRGASPPSFGQIVEHASAMAAGTHITKRGQDSGKKEFASFQDYNEWAKRHDPECRRIKEGITIKGTMIKRSDYRLQPVH